MKYARTPRANISLLIGLLVLGACSGPAIDDWPPIAPPVPEAVINDYVQRYTADVSPPPIYDADDLRALSIVLERRAQQKDNSDTPSIHVPPSLRDDEDRNGAKRSANEINTIERRVRRKYESRHDRRHELRAKYGL